MNLSGLHYLKLVTGYLGFVVLCLFLSYVAVAIHPAVAFAFIGGIWFMVLGLRWPFVFLLIFIAVLLSRPAEFFPPLQNLYPAKLTAVLALATFVLGKIVRADSHLVSVEANKWVGALAVGVLLSAIFGASASYGLAFYKDAFVKILIIYFLIVNLIVVPKQGLIFMWVIVAIGAGLSVVVLMKAQAGVELVEGTRVALEGVLADPNDLALVLLLGAPFLAASVTETRGVSRLVSVGLLVLVVAGILATQSRGGLLGFMIGAGLLLNKKVKNKVVVAGFVGVLALALIAASGIASRATVQSRDGGLDQSSKTRITAWKAGVRMFVHNPVFGVGVDQFPAHYLTYAVNPPVWRGFDAHNSYVKALAETGIVGFVPFCMLLWLTIRGAWRLDKYSQRVKSDGERALLTGMLPTVGAVFSASFFLSHAWVWFIYILFALVASLSHIYKDELERAQLKE